MLEAKKNYVLVHDGNKWTKKKAPPVDACLCFVDGIVGWSVDPMVQHIIKRLK